MRVDVECDLFSIVEKAARIRHTGTLVGPFGPRP